MKICVCRSVQAALSYDAQLDVIKGPQKHTSKTCLIFSKNILNKHSELPVIQTRVAQLQFEVHAQKKFCFWVRVC